MIGFISTDILIGGPIQTILGLTPKKNLAKIDKSRTEEISVFRPEPLTLVSLDKIVFMAIFVESGAVTEELKGKF